MQNWKKHRNFRKLEKTDGSFTYTIAVNGTIVKVSEEIYCAYAQGGYKMENMEFGLKRNRILRDSKGNTVKNEHNQTVFLPEREISLDKLIDEGWEYPSLEQSTEDTVIGQIEIDNLNICLELLDSNEKELIIELFFKGLTEREYAVKLNITQKAVNKRKHKTLGKLQKLFLKNGTQN